jgi:hypothetical protein
MVMVFNDKLRQNVLVLLIFRLKVITVEVKVKLSVTSVLTQRV